MGQTNQEPSMEDILASIKRIIAEDSEAVTTRPPARGRKGPVAVPDPAPEPEPEAAAPEPVVAAPAPEPQPEAEFDGEPSDVLELTSPLMIPDEEEQAMPAPKPAVAPEPAAAADATILSAPAEAASRTAFAALTQLQVRAESGQPNTLDGLVSDLLRPMLRDWLDRELPALVERLVEAEIKRVSGRG